MYLIIRSILFSSRQSFFFRMSLLIQELKLGVYVSFSHFYEFIISIQIFLFVCLLKEYSKLAFVDSRN